MLRKGSRRRAAHGDQALCKRRKEEIVLKGWNSVYSFVHVPFLKAKTKILFGNIICYILIIQQIHVVVLVCML